jgi:peptide/nickel transport system permease protein
MFFQVGKVQEAFRTRSKKWWAGSIVVVGGSLLVISTLIGLALNSGSGIGLQVVGITVLAGLVFLVSWSLTNNMDPMNVPLPRWLKLILPVFLYVGIALATTYILIPGYAEGGQLALALNIEVLTIGLILIVTEEGYPILRERGPLGLVTFAAFLVISAVTILAVIILGVFRLVPTVGDLGLLLCFPYLTGYAIFIARMYTKKLGPVLILQKRGLKLLPLVLYAGIAIQMTSFVGVLYPDGNGVTFTLVLGGFIFGLIALIVREGYPILKERGTPGFITLAGLLIVFAVLYMTAVSMWIVPYDPTKLEVGPRLQAPQPGFPLGTTSLGQDLLSRTIAGGAIMLQVAALSVVVCFSIGVPLGLATSYRGGKVEKVVGLVMDSIFALPGLVLAIAIAAMLGPGVVNMALAIAVVYIPSYFRVIRSQVLSVKELPYVEAAVVMGARDRDILFRYILPNVLPSAVVVMSINFADAILTAAGLTFIGLGLSVDVPDWSWDLTFGFAQYITGAWWVITFPGIMIVILALGFTLAGEGLNEILTPKLEE